MTENLPPQTNENTTEVAKLIRFELGMSKTSTQEAHDQAWQKLAQQLSIENLSLTDIQSHSVAINEPANRTEIFYWCHISVILK